MVLQGLRLLQEQGVLSEDIQLILPEEGNTELLIFKDVNKFPTAESLQIDPEILSNKAIQNGLPERQIEIGTAHAYNDAVRTAKDLFEAAIDETCLKNEFTKQSIEQLVDKIKKAFTDSLSN